MGYGHDVRLVVSIDEFASLEATSTALIRLLENFAPVATIFDMNNGVGNMLIGNRIGLRRCTVVGT